VSDDGVIDNFRDLVHARLGPLVLAVFDFRMNGDETKALVSSVEYGEPYWLPDQATVDRH